MHLGSSRGSVKSIDSDPPDPPIGLAILDRELRHVRVNQRIAEINGRSVAETIGLTMRDMAPELAPALEPLVREALEESEPVTGFEFPGLSFAAPGVRRRWRVSYYPVLGSDGRADMVGAVVEEVTRERQAETALRRLVRELRASISGDNPRSTELVARLARAIGANGPAHPPGLEPGPLPAHHPHLGPMPENPAPQQILVVDPEDESAESLSELLQFWGHSVWVSAGAPQALRLLETERLDVLILARDPGVSPDRETARLLDRARTGGLAVIQFTGASQPAGGGFTLGGLRYSLAKPVDPERLRTLLALLPSASPE